MECLISNNGVKQNPFYPVIYFRVILLLAYNGHIKTVHFHMDGVCAPVYIKDSYSIVAVCSLFLRQRPRTLSCQNIISQEMCFTLRQINDKIRTVAWCEP